MGKKKEKFSASKAIYSKFLWLDMFGEPASLEIDGETSFNTFLGALLSIVILIIVVPYGKRKYEIMQEFNDTTFANAVV